MSIRYHIGLFFVFISSLVGCTQQAPTTAESANKSQMNRPASLAAGVAQLQEYQEAVKAAFAAGKPQECDDAIHQAADLLSVLPSVAKEEGTFDEASLETIQSVSKKLFDQFAHIHHGFHGEHADHDGEHGDHDGEHGEHADHDATKGPELNAYEAVAEEMTSALNELSALAGNATTSE